MKAPALCQWLSDKVQDEKNITVPVSILSVGATTRLGSELLRRPKKTKTIPLNHVMHKLKAIINNALRATLARV